MGSTVITKHPLNRGTAAELLLLLSHEKVSIELPLVSGGLFMVHTFAPHRVQRPVDCDQRAAARAETRAQPRGPPLASLLPRA